MPTINPWIILGLVGALLASLLGGGVIGWHERSIRVPAELAAQQTTDNKACLTLQAVTQGANDAIKKDRDDISAKLKSLKLQRPNACVPVTPSPSISVSGGQYAGQNGGGVSSDWLRDYAAESERYRAELLVCIDFMQKERVAIQ